MSKKSMRLEEMHDFEDFTAGACEGYWSIVRWIGWVAFLNFGVRMECSNSCGRVRRSMKDRNMVVRG